MKNKHFEYENRKFELVKKSTWKRAMKQALQNQERPQAGGYEWYASIEVVIVTIDNDPNLGELQFFSVKGAAEWICENASCLSSVAAVVGKIGRAAKNKNKNESLEVGHGVITKTMPYKG